VSPARTRQKKLLEAAEGYLELGLPSQALERLELLAPDAARRSRALYLKGDALRLLDRFDEAALALSSAADEAPSNVRALETLAWCYKRMGNLPQAIATLERAREIDGSDSSLLYGLACYSSAAGDKAHALEYLARALSLEPSYRARAQTEADFAPFSADPDFRALLEGVVGSHD
jgi:tetratricopeptide (TPR) repeat protein